MQSLVFKSNLLKLLALSCILPPSSAQSGSLPNVDFIGRSFGLPVPATYDYVVVGGGTAGNTIATRLAQDGRFSVAVVEAGGFYETSNGNLSVIPAYAPYYAGAYPEDTNPRVDWGIVSEPQAALNGRRIHMARGKCLGGSSARNFLFYHHATKDTYARWAQEVGDASYEHEAFKEYFARGVHFTQADNSLRAPNASYTYHGTSASEKGGPLEVTVPNYANPCSSHALEGMLAVGVPRASDFLGGELAGVNWITQTIDPEDMTRSSSETSYLRLALKTTGLVVYQDTLAKKILFEGGKRASGVLVDSAGASYTLSATKEIIVASGAFQSPQLLMVSGIGPRATLSELKIRVVVDLPGVGQNLEDQVFMGISYRVNALTHSALGNPDVRRPAEAEYLTSHTGIIGSVGTDVAAFEKLPEPQRSHLSAATRAALATLPPDWPELEYAFLDGYAGDNGNYIFGTPRDAHNYATLMTMSAAQWSRGRVTVRSNDTADRPVVDPRWLSDPIDQELMVAAFKRLREIAATEPMRAIIIGEEVYPGPGVQMDEEILAALRKAAMTVWHPAATCMT